MTQHLERTYIRRRSDVASRIIEGEAIIVKIKTGENYSLNRVGALVWQMADGTHTLVDIVTAIMDRYDITVDQAQADLSEPGFRIGTRTTGGGWRGPTAQLAKGL